MGPGQLMKNMDDGMILTPLFVESENANDGRSPGHVLYTEIIETDDGLMSLVDDKKDVNLKCRRGV